jgi:2-polyprenyl-3-methyl-5-hydroxy-6-metoxy-1,4-benzoquinol methylase
MDSNSYISFYDEQQEVPVNQIDSGSIAHKLRRQRLFSSLGIPRLAFYGKRVLEVGPGVGDNAKLLLANNLKSLVLFDGSKTAIEILNKKFATEIAEQKVFIKQLDINSEEIEERFDIVICEGMVPGQYDSHLTVNKLKTLVDVNGILIISTQSYISVLSETLRRIIGKSIINKCAEDREKAIELCTNFFAPSFDSLKNKSRLDRDWVIDVLIHDWDKFRGAHVYEISDAVKDMGKNFEILGSLPDFAKNLHWYKQDVEVQSIKTKKVLENYEIDRLLLFDYRTDQSSIQSLSFKERISISNRLNFLCMSIYNLHISNEPFTKSKVIILEKYLDELIVLSEYFSVKTVSSLQDYRSHISYLLETSDLNVLKDFHNWWGRGQQYISFERTTM